LNEISFIEEDQIMMALDSCSIQPNPEWNLDRITEKNTKINGRYVYPEGSGATAVGYVIDTGVYCAHQEFDTRCSFGFVANPTWTKDDKNGHGTHVASTMGGTLYGVAKKLTIIAVKVLGDDGSGTNAGVIAGIDYAAKAAKSSGKPSVANMSLGGSASTALDTAVNNAVDGGLFMAVAAGNDNKDANGYSPARAAKATCVASAAIENMGGTQEDLRSYFSNWGSRIDIFAPGSSIKGAWIGNPSATNTISGTSMASPHVAGVAALFVATYPKPADLKAFLISQSEPNQVDLDCATTACSNTPNRYLYSPC